MFLTQLLTKLTPFTQSLCNANRQTVLTTAEEKKRYLAILQQNPQDYSVRHLLALVLFEEGKIRAAEEQLRRAITINPDFAAAHHDLGSLLRETGRIAESEASFDRAFLLEPPFSSDYALDSSCTT
ncbi:MAG: tetratricopeptide repeat protein [Cyanobacteria bacterium P01_F01_bin.150]